MDKKIGILLCAGLSPRTAMALASIYTVDECVDVAIKMEDANEN